MHYADYLQKRIIETSPVCVGLDPVIPKLPEGIAKDVGGVKDFCIGIIDAVAADAAAVKPQLAYFELLGWEGMKVFFEVCEYAKKKISSSLPMEKEMTSAQRVKHTQMHTLEKTVLSTRSR